MKHIAIRSLSVSLKRGQTLLHPLNTDLRPGESLTLLGASGCGKTTTLNALLGLLPQAKFSVSGNIFFDDTDLNALSPRCRRAYAGSLMALIPQNPMTAFDPSLSIGRQLDETLRVHSRLKGAERRLKILDALKQSGLRDAARAAAARPDMLSGGMLQRAAIAAALMLDAPLILADEPTTALDAVHRSAVVEQLKSLRAKGHAVLLVTHDFFVAREIGGKLMVMDEGRVVESGETERILACPAHPVTRSLLSARRLVRERGYGDA